MLRQRQGGARQVWLSAAAVARCAAGFEPLQPASTSRPVAPCRWPRLTDVEALPLASHRARHRLVRALYRHRGSAPAGGPHASGGCHNLKQGARSQGPARRRRLLLRQKAAHSLQEPRVKQSAYARSSRCGGSQPGKGSHTVAPPDCFDFGPVSPERAQRRNLNRPAVLEGFVAPRQDLFPNKRPAGSP